MVGKFVAIMTIKTLGLAIGLSSINFFLDAVYESPKYLIGFVVCLVVGVALIIFPFLG